jgi:prepilin-type N-terminal cleavage/methylation domain-containing protein
MIKRIFNSSRGFTVLESMVAIMVISLAIAGVFSAVQQSLSQSIVSKDEVKAFYLAQEAIEIIRNKRDENQLYKISNPATSNTWLYGISEAGADPCYFGKVCEVDAVDMSLSYCGPSWNSCPVLRQNSTTFLYGYDGSWPASNFKREIQIESVNANEIAVTVRISWTKGILSKEFKAKTYLFKWI